MTTTYSADVSEFWPVPREVGQKLPLPGQPGKFATVQWIADGKVGLIA